MKDRGNQDARVFAARNSWTIHRCTPAARGIREPRGEVIDFPAMPSNQQPIARRLNEAAVETEVAGGVGLEPSLHAARALHANRSTPLNRPG
jgi:hypothetical protein